MVNNVAARLMIASCTRVSKSAATGGTRKVEADGIVLQSQIMRQTQHLRSVSTSDNTSGTSSWQKVEAGVSVERMRIREASEIAERTMS